MTKGKPMPHVPIDVATDAWLAVVRAYNECTTTLVQRLNQLGITLLQHEILVNLLRTPGLTQRQLSERCFSAKSGVSMLIARFEKEGLVERSRSSTDHRAWNLSLTRAGQDLAHRAAAIQTDVVLQMTQAYSPEELEDIKRLMDDAAALLRDMRDSEAVPVD